MTCACASLRPRWASFARLVSLLNIFYLHSLHNNDAEAVSSFGKEGANIEVGGGKRSVAAKREEDAAKEKM